MPYFEMFPTEHQQMQKHRSKVLGVEPYFHDDVFVRASEIGAWTEIGRGSYLVESTFGDYSYTAGHAQIIYADVGKFCSIASHVRINPGNHPMWRVTQHHMTYRRQQYGFGPDGTEVFAWRRSNRVTVGHDVWLGHNVTLMPGVNVGHGAVVGAGAVVTKDIDPYTVAVGVPAKPIRQRFTDAQAGALIEIAYWDWDHEMIKDRFDDLLDIDVFVEKYG
ncbi:MAG: DapH/DapD/GlmU-related protein [Chloroflexota bacterium]